MLDDDGLPLDDVGAWAKDKHDRLRKYVDISRAARRKFVEGSGGATYIDLYCGAGRAVVRETGKTIDGSPLVAFKCAREGAFHSWKFTLRMPTKQNAALLYNGWDGCLETGLTMSIRAFPQRFRR